MLYGIIMPIALMVKTDFYKLIQFLLFNTASLHHILDTIEQLH